jgi:hypothetical protein
MANRRSYRLPALALAFAAALSACSGESPISAPDLAPPLYETAPASAPAPAPAPATTNGVECDEGYYFDLETQTCRGILGGGTGKG